MARNTKLKQLLENLPEGLILNLEDNCLDAFCSDCKKIIKYEIRQRNIKNPPYYCRSCAQRHKTFSEESLKAIAEGAKKRSGKGACSKCGKESESRNAAGLCEECRGYLINVAENNKTEGICSICGVFNKERDQNARGKECGCSQKWYIEHNSSETMVSHSKENLDKLNSMHDEFCEICGKETSHNGFGVCLTCHPESKGSLPNFIIKDKVRYYKNIEVNKFVEMIKSGELNIEYYPGMNWRGDRLCYYIEDILTGDLLKLTNSNFYEINGIRYYKGFEINEFSSKILSGELNINDYLGINIRHGKVCYYTEDVITGDIIKLSNSNFKEINGIRYYKTFEINEFVEKIKIGELDINDYPGINIRCGRVCYETEDIITSNKILMNNNFVELDGVKFYKNIEINELIRQLDNGEIEIPPGFSKRFDRWCYNTEDILTGETIKLNGSNFEERDNILYFLDKSIGKYVPWEDYKKKFEQEKFKHHDFILDDISFKYGGEFLPTFITKDSPENCGHAAFDQLLKEKNIGWFVYIKLFRRTDISEIHPLVVGKSGSLLVNASGCDLSFSKDIEHGPSRLFLFENNYDYFYDKVWVIPVNSEAEAYNLEEKIQIEFDLFGS